MHASLSLAIISNFPDLTIVFVSSGVRLSGLVSLRFERVGCRAQTTAPYASQVSHVRSSVVQTAAII